MAIAMFDMLDEYEILRIVKESDIWSVCMLMRTSHRLRDIIMTHKKDLFQQILGIDLEGSPKSLFELDYIIPPLDHFILPSDWYDFDLETYVMFFALFNAFEIDSLSFLKVDPYLELLWSNDFYPDVIELDLGYQETIDHDKITQFSWLYFNGYKFVHEPCLFGNDATASLSLSGRHFFNTRKYADQLSSPTEFCSPQKTKILDSLSFQNPLVFVKAGCKGDRTRARDLIKLLLEHVPRHCPTWIRTAISSIEYTKKIHLGLTYTHVKVNCFSLH